MGKIEGLVFSAIVWISDRQSLYRWFMRLLLPFGIMFWCDQILAANFKTVLNA